MLRIVSEFVAILPNFIRNFNYSPIDGALQLLSFTIILLQQLFICLNIVGKLISKRCYLKSYPLYYILPSSWCANVVVILYNMLAIDGAICLYAEKQRYFLVEGT